MFAIWPLSVTGYMYWPRSRLDVSPRCHSPRQSYSEKPGKHVERRVFSPMEVGECRGRIGRKFCVEVVRVRHVPVRGVVMGSRQVLSRLRRLRYS